MVHDRYQAVKEVADRLLVSEAKVRNCIKGRNLRAVDIGKGWRIADTDLNFFLSKHATREREQTSACDVPAASVPAGKDRPTYWTP